MEKTYKICSDSDYALKKGIKEIQPDFVDRFKKLIESLSKYLLENPDKETSLDCQAFSLTSTEGF